MANKLSFGEVQYVAQLPLAGHYGTYFFVDSVNGSDGNSGKKPQQALATIAGAYSLCTAGLGDVIVVAPFHAETITATSHNFAKKGIQVVGLGNGTSRPVFTYGAAAATITVAADNVTFENCVFKANFADVAAAFTLGAAKNFVVKNSAFIDTSLILNFLSCVVTGATANAADGLQILNNHVWSLPTTDGPVLSVLGDCDRIRFIGNFITKDATNDAGHAITVAAKVCRNILIYDNQLMVVGATSSAVGIFMTGSSTTNTGMMARNLVSSLDTTAALLLTATLGIAVHENYVSGVIAASGTIFPAVDNPA